MSSAAKKDIAILKNKLVVYFKYLTDERRRTLLETLDVYGFDTNKVQKMGIFQLPRFLVVNDKTVDLANVISIRIGISALHEWSKRCLSQYDEKIPLADVLKRSHHFASILESRRQEIIDILTEYETYKVAEDEINRSIDLFANLNENSSYYRRVINGVISYLPRNQPLYALSCFGLVLSYMTHSTYVCVPSYMQQFFGRLMECIGLHSSFPNVVISYERQKTTDFCSQLLYDPHLQCWIPRVEAVIFTGNPENAKKVKNQFDKRTLFIGNGAGHNPVVITPSADVESAIEAALELQLYNQGQDCAAPNSFLAHESIYEQFVNGLVAKLKKVPVGAYQDKSSIVGPVTKTEDLTRIQKILIENRKWIRKDTPGVIRIASKIIEPTVIEKPLLYGGNYTEQLAPIFFIQKYHHDFELAQYFETQAYWQNAMYITVYGSSEYVDSLIHYRLPNGGILHTKDTIIHNTHLHAKGVERGIKSYGGYGRNASWISISDQIVSKPTLPQRDIFQHIVLPTIEKEQILKCLRARILDEKLDSRMI